MRVITRDLVLSVGTSPAFKVLLQTGVRTSVMPSSPALTNSAGILSTPADFSIFSDIATVSTSVRRIGRGSLSGICTVGSPLVSWLYRSWFQALS